MQTRIKYISRGKTLVTSNPILCGTSLYVVTINVDETEARLEEVGGNNQVYIAKAVTLSGLKKHIKQLLKNLGATFGQEIRNKGETRKL